MWETLVRGREPQILSDVQFVEATLIPSLPREVPAFAGAWATAALATGGARVSEFGPTEADLAALAREVKGEYVLEGPEFDGLDAISLAGRETARKSLSAPLASRYAATTDADARAGLRIMAALGEAKTPEKALAATARALGWTAALEGGKPLPYEAYRDALDMGIPVILKSASERDRWLVALGYVETPAGRFLLVVDASEVPMPRCRVARTPTSDYEAKPPTTQAGAYRFSRDGAFPEGGAWFEPFDEARYVPYFLHDWRPATEAYRDAVAKVVKKAE